MTIGDRICRAREALDITQEELGKRVGTTKQTIYKYEKSIVTNIPMDRLQDIADALHVEAAYLMGWRDVQESEADKKKAEIMSLLSSASPTEINQVKQYIQFVLSQRESQE